MECLESKYPGQVVLSDVGSSSEGRRLKLVKISSNNFSAYKKAIWIDCGIHAREWISPATCAYIMRELVEKSDLYSTILDSFDFYIMPSMNPGKKL